MKRDIKGAVVKICPRFKRKANFGYHNPWSLVQKIKQHFGRLFD
jgi:hypothetical protein